MRLLFVPLLLVGCIDQAATDDDRLVDHMAALEGASDTIANRDVSLINDVVPDPFEHCMLLSVEGTSSCEGWSGCSWDGTAVYECACGTITEFCSGSDWSPTTCHCTSDGAEVPCGCF